MMTELGHKLTPDEVLTHLGGIAVGIAEKGEQHVAMLHVLRGNPEDGYLPFGIGMIEMPEADADRDALVTTIHQLLDEQEADAYVFINEAWMVRIKATNIDEALASMTHRPSEDPQREEWLMLHFVNREGFSLMDSYQIMHEGGKRVIGPRHRGPGILAGRMGNFFRRGKDDHEIGH